MSGPFDSKEWLDYAAHFRDHVLPKITESNVMVTLGTDKPDVKFMLEVGAAVVLDKPIVLLVPSGRTIPPKLARVADKIIEADISTKAGMQTAEQALREYLKQ